ARGSAGETRSMLRVKLRSIKDPNLKSQISDLIDCAISCSRQLRGWADSLQNSDIPGQRHLNERTRRDYEQKKRATEFQKEFVAAAAAWPPLEEGRGGAGADLKGRFQISNFIF